MSTANKMRLKSSILLSEKFPQTLTLNLIMAINMPSCSKPNLLIISIRYI